MKAISYFRAAVAGASLFAGTAGAAEPVSEVVPASGLRHKSVGPLWPRSPSMPSPCPPSTPCPPGTLPPTVPPKDPNVPPDPGAMPPAPSPDLQATQAGGGAERTALPQVFGDAPAGGGSIAGPLPIRTLNGQFIGPAPVFILPNGQRMTAQNPGGQRTVTDELLLSRPAVLPADTPGGTITAITPPPGAVFAPEFAAAVARIPLVTRGAFKITENDTPRPTTRFYTTYNFYDQILRGYGGPNTPRIVLHQETVGYEQAFADQLYSVGIRVPYNQIVSPGFFNSTALGDLTLLTKAVLWEDTRTGDLLSGGLVVTIPTASEPIVSTTTGQEVRPTLIQPYLGYILNRGDWFVQGFSSIVVPTDDRDVTFIANDMAIGYQAYRARGQFLSSVIPVVELHLNNPLNHRGKQEEPVGMLDQFTILGGTHFQFYDRSSIGFACGAPLTGPRPFSLQATVQLNVRF